MAVTYDNSAKSGYQTSLPSGTAFTWSQTVATGSYGLVAVYSRNFGYVNLSATALVKFGSTTLTSLGNVYINNNSAQGWIWVFGANNVPSGSQTVSVTLTETSQNFNGWGVSFTYTNVSSVGTLQTAFGSSGTGSVSVSSATGNAVWGTIAGPNNAPSYSSFSLTTRQTDVSNFPSFIAGDTSGTSSVTVSANFTSEDWAAAGLNLIGATANTGQFFAMM